MTGTDLAPTIAPKSDQLNADDLIGGPITIRITGVKGSQTKEQPIDIHFENDAGKPYKPCKSMRRVLVQLWGRDGAAYVGRSLTLYRDEKVRFGGVDVGGIRISHMSDIPAETTMALTASKTSRKPYTVKPLKVSSQQSAVSDKQPEDLATRRKTMVDYFRDEYGLTWPQVIASVGRDKLSDVTEEDIDTLKDKAARLKKGEPLDVIFPPPAE